MTLSFDILWEETVPGVHKSLARHYEHHIVRYAFRRFAITEFARDYLEAKHNSTFELLPHTIDPTYLNDLSWRPLSNSPSVVHFAGSVYPRMNLDSLLRLIEASRLTRHSIRLDMCTHFRFEDRDVDISYRYLPQQELINAQRHADILFLPQAFTSDAPMMIRNNLPTKLMDYLVSGRPILIHSPSDSYLNYLARREGFALIVERPDPFELAVAIDKLLRDHNLQRQLVANAFRFAETRRSDRWANYFYDAITVADRNNRPEPIALAPWSMP
jgi:glycosyltransferase involved in cell wall biosynthesis